MEIKTIMKTRRQQNGENFKPERLTCLKQQGAVQNGASKQPKLKNKTAYSKKKISCKYLFLFEQQLN